MGTEVQDAEYEVLRQAPKANRGLLPVAAPPRAKAHDGHAVLAGEGARDAMATWEEAGGQTPTPRHRRRLILKWLRDLSFADCLDAGCSRPDLLHEILKGRQFAGKPVAGFGCHPTDPGRLVGLPDPMGCSFLKLDPSRQVWPASVGSSNARPGEPRQFDLVVCSELLGQTPQWRPALANLIRMTRRYLLITAPAGPIRMADRVAGHVQHFDGLELAGAIVGHGLTLLKQRRWGFPIHSLYRSAMGSLPPEKLQAPLPPAAGPGSLPMRLVSQGLYLAFFSNDLFHGGAQHMVLAQRGSGAYR